MKNLEMTILLVEDQPAHAKLIERAFESAGSGFRLSVASSLREAQKLLTSSTPDVVIADLELPDGRGTDLIRHDRGVPAFPVVVLTSHGNEQVAVEAMKAGALDYVVKSSAVMRDLPRIAAAAIREWTHLVERRRAEMARTQSLRLLEVVLDSLSAQVAVLDDNGMILMVNSAWANESSPNPFSGKAFGVTVNYLSACANVTGEMEPAAHAIVAGVRDVITGIQSQFCVEVQCYDTPDQRWYQVEVSPFSGAGAARAVVLFEDISERKQTENEARDRAIHCERLATLSDREHEVMTMVVAGKANKVIARDLGRSEKTVEKHRANVMKKLKVRTIADLVRIAVSIER
ncbi:response regulator transcription factor [Symmachiella dynata]|uniref:response regulator transcription factor n=1 Tax=Symmachiella dynata TaxID=2527995 RepID=UPI0030EF6774